MNPWDLSAADLVVWGLVAHVIADWLLQNDWMAANKARRNDCYWLTRPEHAGASAVPGRWWDRHPAAYVHAGIHGVALALVFGAVALPLAAAHLLIDTRTPVAWFSKRIRQTQPRSDAFPLVDVGLLVRFNVDQTWHVATIALAALVVHA